MNFHLKLEFNTQNIKKAIKHCIIENSSIIKSLINNYGIIINFKKITAINIDNSIYYNIEYFKIKEKKGIFAQYNEHIELSVLTSKINNFINRNNLALGKDHFCNEFFCFNLKNAIKNEEAKTIGTLYI